MFDPVWQSRWEDLLRKIPELREKDQRRDLLDCLSDFPVWLSLTESDLIEQLRSLPSESSREPVLETLAWMRQLETTKRSPDTLRTIEALESDLRSRTARPRKEPWKKEPPYRGLNAFDRRHAPIFFGREAELQRLVEVLAIRREGPQFTAVVGASGSGKSSLVRAGLWARLEAGAVPELPGSEQWLVTTMKPFEMRTPFDSLASCLAQSLKETNGFEDKVGLAKDAARGSLSELAGRLLAGADPRARWLLILDQMEELFTSGNAPETAEFLRELLGAAKPLGRKSQSRFQVMATLRADFEHYSLEYPPLAEVINAPGGRFTVLAPTRPAMERMVSGPIGELELADCWMLDRELAPAMAADAAGRAGGLALMAFALRALYDHDICRRRLRMDVETYRSPEFGGLGGCIAKHADEVLKNNLDAAGRAAMGRVFAALVRVRQEDAPTRRRAARSTWEGDADALRFVDAFVEARLLVADVSSGHGPVVEVAHEALFQEWPMLAEWIEARREDFHLAERVRAEAAAWSREAQEQRLASPWRRPWPGDSIDLYRKRLQRAGLLEELLREEWVARLLTPDADWTLAEIRDGATVPLRRWELGRRLAEIDDRRPGVGVVDGVPDILWADIPGGAVELKKHGLFPVNPFRMAALPVTFAQFRAFLDAKDGYRKEKPEDAWLKGLANHPVTHVSWVDATAFCKWLSKRRGLEVRLPDEWEWQWAAQSARKDFAYPWGPQWEDGVANTSESGIGHTTAVGIFPQGNSLQGVSDLAGNVWEWCRNQYDDPRQTAEDKTKSRVVRGGAWYGDQDLARAVYRGDDVPDGRSYGVGFRVVCSSPIR